MYSRSRALELCGQIQIKSFLALSGAQEIQILVSLVKVCLELTELHRSLSGLFTLSLSLLLVYFVGQREPKTLRLSIAERFKF